MRAVFVTERRMESMENCNLWRFDIMRIETMQEIKTASLHGQGRTLDFSWVPDQYFQEAT